MRAFSPATGDAGPAWATRYEGGCARAPGPSGSRMCRARRGRVCAPGGQSQRSKLIALSAATIVCMASSAGSVSGWSSRSGRRGSPRARGRRLRSGGRAGRGRRAASRPAAVARQAGVRQNASRVAGVTSPVEHHGGRLRGRRAAGSSSAARAARPPNTKHSLSELDASRFGAVQAGARRLADGIEAGQGRARVKVGGDPTHHVVGGGSNRNQIGVTSMPASASARRRWGTAPDRRRACRARPSARRSARAAR